MLQSAFMLLTLLPSQPAEKPAPPKAPTPATHAAANLRLRSIGPALMSGRVVGFAVHPRDRSQYFVAVASGGVWKTTNAGTTWSPVFDSEGSYSIGCVVLDPKQPNVVWVGTGENNSQRSVGYGDGVYKSTDGGKTWQNVGLKTSEHIAKIIIDPRDSNIVYVAAQGPLWGPGGERGLYKTTDGGKTWTRILHVSEDTGITSIVQDPRNPDVMVAASYQRRRHVYTIVNGGPESAIHRTTDGGKTWSKVRSGLPSTELGRIGLAMAPNDPNTVYAIVEAADKQGGLFRSSDTGATWEKRNPFDAQAQYYSHLVVDPNDRNQLFVMNVNIQFSTDGGRTLSPLPDRFKHVDNHELWIDPSNSNYLLCGCDGGIYESFDRGGNWKFVSNLPVTQFYDVNCEQTETPFYRVYGGTQDNNTLGGPARTRSNHGITNSDWHVLLGGDGFHVQIDPKDPNTVYCEYQYGGLARFDWRTGQRVGIQPIPAPGEAPLRWNWDSPLLISPHKNTRIYFAANRLFQSDDRGDSWKAISPDLSRQLDRNKLPVFGKILPPEAVFKHGSTSIFGNITALAESNKTEGLLFVGTDDGLIQVSPDGGKTWRKIEKFPDVPDQTYVARLLASRHDGNTIYAAFDNHKNADFKPYLLKSTDAGVTWKPIVGDLPLRGSVLAIAEDHVNPSLLFAGTEFGLFFTVDGGSRWHRLRNGLPTVAVRDLAIQRPMNDLLVGTFGRGFYVLDDYAPLRQMSPEVLAKPAAMLPVRDGFLYMQTSQFGGRAKASLGDSFYTADNPPFGAQITFHLKESIQSRKQKRTLAQKGPNPEYPSLDDLRLEAEEEVDSIVAIVRDEQGNLVRTIPCPREAGLHRITWDLRYAAPVLPRSATPGEPDSDSPSFGMGGPYALPGKYRVQIAKRSAGEINNLSEPVEFQVKYVGEAPPTADQWKSIGEFHRDAMKLYRDFSAVSGMASELTTRLDLVKSALDVTTGVPDAARKNVRELIAQHRLRVRELSGDGFLAARNEPTPPSISDRVFDALAATRTAISPPTGTQREQLLLARKSIESSSAAMKATTEKDLKELETILDKLGAPWTPGRGLSK